jgi:hypothetical protein
MIEQPEKEFENIIIPSTLMVRKTTVSSASDEIGLYDW